MKVKILSVLSFLPVLLASLVAQPAHVGPMPSRAVVEDVSVRKAQYAQRLTAYRVARAQQRRFLIQRLAGI